jgi:hypothetical protein
VIILDDTDRCPLCKHVLETDGAQMENRYPDARVVTQRFRFVENLFLFLSIALACVLLFVNYQTDPAILWSPVVVLVLFYANVVLRLAIVGKNGYMFKIVSLVILAVMTLLGIDYLTGYHGWSLKYVLPAGILALDLAIIILMLVNRRNWQSYMMAQLFTIVLSLVPVILQRAGVVRSTCLIWIAFLASVLLFAGTVILGDRRARTELKRRFHI